jgi:hypothetical protein
MGILGENVGPSWGWARRGFGGKVSIGLRARTGRDRQCVSGDRRRSQRLPETGRAICSGPPEPLLRGILSAAVRLIGRLRCASRRRGNSRDRSSIGALPSRDPPPTPLERQWDGRKRDCRARMRGPARSPQATAEGSAAALSSAEELSAALVCQVGALDRSRSSATLSSTTALLGQSGIEQTLITARVVSMRREVDRRSSTNHA